MSSRLSPRCRSYAAVVITVAGLLAACGRPPRYRFASSSADDVVFRLPWSWNEVRSGAPVGSDGKTASDGSWYAVYDADPHPSVNHATSLRALSPVVLARTVIVDKSAGSSITDDQLRDVALPVTATARASQTPTGATFRLLADGTIRTRTERGVHVRYSYDLGKGAEIFDQIAVVDASKTHVHVLLVHCDQACFDANRTDITTLMASFTVKTP